MGLGGTTGPWTCGRGSNRFDSPHSSRHGGAAFENSGPGCRNGFARVPAGVQLSLQGALLGWRGLLRPAHESAGRSAFGRHGDGPSALKAAMLPWIPDGAGPRFQFLAQWSLFRRQARRGSGSEGEKGRGNGGTQAEFAIQQWPESGGTGRSQALQEPAAVGAV